MIREVKFESQDRRIKQIIAALNENGIKDMLFPFCVFDKEVLVHS